MYPTARTQLWPNRACLEQPDRGSGTFLASVNIGVCQWCLLQGFVAHLLYQCIYESMYVCMYVRVCRSYVDCPDRMAGFPCAAFEEEGLYACVCNCIYACTCMYVHACVCMCMYLYVCAIMYVGVSLCVHVCACKYPRIYIYIYTYAYVYIYIYT